MRAKRSGPSVSRGTQGIDVDRTCERCQFFIRHHSTKFGICSHPRHVAFGVVPLVRGKETHCRRGFGDDDWTPRPAVSNGHAAIHPEDHCIAEYPSPPDHRRPGRYLTPIMPSTDGLPLAD
jgi:hypothetical protein